MWPPRGSRLCKVCHFKFPHNVQPFREPGRCSLGAILGHLRAILGPSYGHLLGLPWSHLDVLPILCCCICSRSRLSLVWYCLYILLCTLLSLLLSLLLWASLCVILVVVAAVTAVIFVCRSRGRILVDTHNRGTHRHTHRRIIDAQRETAQMHKILT